MTSTRPQRGVTVGHGSVEPSAWLACSGECSVGVSACDVAKKPHVLKSVLMQPKAVWKSAQGITLAQ